MLAMTRRTRSRLGAPLATLFAALATLFAASHSLVACGSSSSNPTAGGGGGGGGVGAGGGGDPCAGLGCASDPGPLIVAVLNAAGSPVASPTFTENGRRLSIDCETDGGQILLDAGECGAWHVDEFSVGAHTITVSAAGYASQTINVTIQGPAGCCGQGPEVDQTVTLSATSDAGDGG